MATSASNLAEIETMLSTSTFFRGLSAYDCRELARRCRRRTVNKRDTVFIEDTVGSAMYLLVKGNVQLVKTDAEGREIVVRTLKPGDVFAEVVLQRDSVYPVSAVALSRAELLELQRREIFGLLEKRDFRDDFISFLMKKQRYLAERVRYLTSYDVEERLFRFLHEQYGDACVIQTGMSKKDVAAAIGATPETLSRLIQRLRDEIGFSWEKGELRLPDGFWASRDDLLF